MATLGSAPARRGGVCLLIVWVALLRTAPAWSSVAIDGQWCASSDERFQPLSLMGRRGQYESFAVATPTAELISGPALPWCEDCAPTQLGQVARLSQIGGAQAREIADAARAAGGRIALMPVRTDAQCGPAPWSGAFPYWEREPGVFTDLVVRPRELWVDGMPTFTVGQPDWRPYPHGRLVPLGGGPQLSPEQYFSLLEVLPVQGNDVVRPGVQQWIFAHPDWAAIYPASAILRGLDADARIITPDAAHAPLSAEQLRP